METIIYEKRDRIAYLTLNRPEVMNAMNPLMGRELAQAWTDFRDDPEAWVAIVTGAGERAFSAGADLKAMAERTQEDFAREFWHPDPRGSVAYGGIMRGLEVYKPIIAAVNGFALGGGLELALSCDIRIASENARFGLAEVTRALIPGAGGTQRLPRMIPMAIAMHMLLTGEPLDAQEAYRVGLVNKVVPAAELIPTAEGIARRICENGPLAVKAIKEAAYKGLNMTLDHGLRLEQLLSQMIRRTEDAKEGPRAFAEKRKPAYKGE